MDDVQARRLVETYSDMILRIGTHYFGQVCDAEDICQTVFLKYLTENRRFDSPEHEKAWIIRVTLNVCKSRLRSSFFRKTVSLETAGEKAEAAAPEEISGPAAELREALEALPRNYRLSIYLYYFEGYSTREIGRMMGKSDNVISSYLSRGRKKLRETLSEEKTERG